MMVRAPLSFSVSMIEPRFMPSSLTRKMPAPPMPSSGLRMMSPCSRWKARTARRIARHQGRRGELRELRDRQLFVVVADRLRPVEDPRALALGHLQQLGEVDVLHVERRVLAHRRWRRTRTAAHQVAALARYQSSGSPVSVMRATSAMTVPSSSAMSRCSNAYSAWPRRAASRIIAKVVSL